MRQNQNQNQNQINTMKNIDLTGPEAALIYLKSLPGDQIIVLPSQGESNAAGDAVRACTDIPAHEWAASHGRWDWTAADLVQEMEWACYWTLRKQGEDIAAEELLEMIQLKN